MEARSRQRPKRRPNWAYRRRWFGLRSGEAGRLNRIMLVGHIAFGVGIGLWAPRFAERRSRR